MSHAYYYFIASLPLLEFGQAMPFSFEEFRQQCARLLTPQDLVEVERVLDQRGKESRNAFLQRWQGFDAAFRQELAQRRRQRYGQVPAGTRAVLDSDPRFSEVFNRADQEQDLLAAQRLVDLFQWQEIDEISRGYFFTLEIVLGYSLKLMILARYEAMGSAVAGQKFQQFQNQIDALIAA